MLLALDTTNKSIEALTSGSSGDVTFVVTYADSTATSFVEGSNEGALGTTDTTVAASPAASTRRVVKDINFFNTTAASRTVTLKYNNNGTRRTLVVISLDGEASWSMAGGSGGGGISSLQVGITPVTGTNGHILYVNNAILGELATTGSGSVVLSSSPTLITPLVTTSLDATASTFNLLNSVPTIINFGAAATSFTLGGATSAVLNLAPGSGSVVNLGGGANAAELRFLEPSGSGTNYTALKAQAQAANVTYTLPAADGSNGQVLATNGSGVLSWAAGGTGGGGTYKNIVTNGAMSLTNYKQSYGFVAPLAITSTSTTINIGIVSGAIINNAAGSVAAFPPAGVVLVNNSELISYSSKTTYTAGPAALTVASGGRGYDGTVAASASVGSTVTVMPYHLDITSSGYYTADRWRTHINNTVGTWEQAVVNDAPSNTMFRRSLRMKCTTANAAVDAADILRIEQLFEGQNVQHIRKGTTNAQQLTCSFFVKSNVTGTYIVELVDNNNSRRVSASYSITSANTWQEVSITFPADTTGVLNNDNAYSLGLCFWLVAGSTYSSGGSLQTTWGTATNTRAVGQVNLSANAGQSWQITGVQLELGTSKTAFEYLHINDIAATCARYYRFFPATGVDDTLVSAPGADVSYNMLITPAMRVAPTIPQAAGDVANRANTDLDIYTIGLNNALLAFQTRDSYILLQARVNVTTGAVLRVFLYRPLYLDAELAGGN